MTMMNSSIPPVVQGFINEAIQRSEAGQSSEALAMFQKILEFMAVDGVRDHIAVLSAKEALKVREAFMEMLERMVYEHVNARRFKEAFKTYRILVAMGYGSDRADTLESYLEHTHVRHQWRQRIRMIGVAVVVLVIGFTLWKSIFGSFPFWPKASPEVIRQEIADLAQNNQPFEDQCIICWYNRNKSDPAQSPSHCIEQARIAAQAGNRELALDWVKCGACGENTASLLVDFNSNKDAVLDALGYVRP
jgi:hypothetical protein